MHTSTLTAAASFILVLQLVEDFRAQAKHFKRQIHLCLSNLLAVSFHLLITHL